MQRGFDPAMNDFGSLNWAILLLYITSNLVLGFFIGRKMTTASSFYLGSRNIPWWAIGISVIATYVSALSFLGGPAWSYTDGLSVIAIHMNYPLVIFFVVVFFLPFFYNSGAASIYDYIEKRFGPSARMVLSAIFLVSQALTSAAILYATALILEFITGIDVAQVIVLVAVIALIYTVMGGIAAVIWTDVIQSAVLLVGAVIIFFALLNGLSMPLPEVLSELKAAGKINPLDLSLDPTRVTTLWTGVIAMSLFHITVYGANQMMVQRTLASKSIGDAKKSYLMMGFSAFFIYFLFILLGVLFYSFYEGREFENGNTIILQFASDTGIPGLMGILAAAVVAASLSSLDSSFNSLATISTIDFYQKYFKRDGDEKHYLLASRAFTVLWALLIIGPAILYSRSEGSILETLSKVGSYFVGAKLSMYALGFFSRHTTERGLLGGVVAGFAVVWAVAVGTDLAWPWYCLVGAAVNVVVSVGLSLLMDGRQSEWSPYTIRGQQAQFAAGTRPEKAAGWFVVPGRVDRICWLLPVFFLLSLLFLFLFQVLV